MYLLYPLGHACDVLFEDAAMFVNDPDDLCEQLLHATDIGS